MQKELDNLAQKAVETSEQVAEAKEQVERSFRDKTNTEGQLLWEQVQRNEVAIELGDVRNANEEKMDRIAEEEAATERLRESRPVIAKEVRALGDKYVQAQRDKATLQ
ncbi:unnamed protein product, partial [Prorocentrum cordatum]